MEVRRSWVGHSGMWVPKGMCGVCAVKPSGSPHTTQADEDQEDADERWDRNSVVKRKLADGGSLNVIKMEYREADPMDVVDSKQGVAGTNIKVEPGLGTNIKVEPGVGRNIKVEPGVETNIKMEPGVETNIKVEPGVSSGKHFDKRAGSRIP